MEIESKGNEMNEIVVNGVTYKREQSYAENDGLPYVIVRARDAGVHAGYLVSRNDKTKEADLVDSRRLWRWHGRTLSGLSLEGTDAPEKCKFGDPIGTVDRRHVVAGYCEILPCTEVARESLQSVKVWEND